MTSPRLSTLFAEIDRYNNEDPNRIPLDNGHTTSKEQLYSQRMQTQLQEYVENPEEVLHIAAYSQHIQRWKIPRNDYPMNRNGYYRWRTELGKFHANTTAKLMQAQGYDDSDIHRVKDLLQKKDLRQDAQTQTLEDVICLVFLRHYLEDFVRQHSEDKIISIIQKTWRKMSTKAQQWALTLDLPPHLSTLLGKALK